MNSYHNSDVETVIELSRIEKSFEGTVFLKDISLSIRRGQFVSILGPSGCGKTTLLNLITGLVLPDKGTISIKGKFGYMQQKDLLLPWKSVIENVILPFQLQGIPLSSVTQKAKDLLPQFELEGVEDKYPHQLSGGMRQRVAFMRTYFTSDEIMLLDEPFAALDTLTKETMQRWLLTMKARWNPTIVLITHDIEEAIFLSDIIYLMGTKPGTIQTKIPVTFCQDDKNQRLVSHELLEMKQEILQVFASETNIERL